MGINNQTVMLWLTYVHQHPTVANLHYYKTDEQRRRRQRSYGNKN